jgi:hypothetical protein
VTLFIVGLLVLGWWTLRTHRRRNQLLTGGAVNAVAWRLAHRRRFHIGPRRWRLDKGNTL